MSQPSRRRWAMVIEDDSAIRESIADVLTSEGYETSTCENGRQALDHLQHAMRPDVIVLDLMMPIMDGWQFRLEQKKDPSLAAIPVVAMSADGTAKAAAIDADAYLRKPVGYDDLVGTVARVVLKRECELIRERTLSAEHEARVATLNSLKEKEILLQEVHHRVKNNLQVVASLINMQRRVVTSGPASDALEECGARIASIALVHEMLYKSNDFGRVPFHDYIRTLSLRILAAAGDAGGRVTLDFDLRASVVVPIDKAVPCGLIVNELVTNALKHAFPDDRRGTVRVELSSDDDMVRLAVSDDGIGLPSGFEMQGAGGLGIRLMTTLARQLRAELSVERFPGAAFRVAFPLSRTEADA